MTIVPSLMHWMYSTDDGFWTDGVKCSCHTNESFKRSFFQENIIRITVLSLMIIFSPFCLFQQVMLGLVMMPVRAHSL